VKGRRCSSLAALSLILLLPWLAACGGAAPSPAGAEETARPAPDLQAQAAAEATAIIQQAQATALVLQAQAQATALLQQAQAGEPTPAAQPTRALPLLTSTPGPLPEEQPTPPVEAPETMAGAVVTTTVELLWVGFAADGAFVIVNYVAHPAAAQAFWPGMLSVTDEASGTVFNEVPVMPVIGPLIARPLEAGQPGYVMLVHAPAILRPGSLVTVDLAGHRFEHVPLQ